VSDRQKREPRLAVERASRRVTWVAAGLDDRDVHSALSHVKDCELGQPGTDPTPLGVGVDGDDRSGRPRIDAVLRIGSIVLRVDDLQRQSEFWRAALGYVRRDDETSDDFVLLGPPYGGGPHLSLDRVRSSLQIPPRLHLDLYTENQADEVQRLLALGATEIHWDKRPVDADYVILADPEGNRFCVVDTAPRAAA